MEDSLHNVSYKSDPRSGPLLISSYSNWQVVDTAQDGAIQALRDRLMKEDADLTTEERAKIRGKLEEIANSGQW